jgi:hypothetical protein
MAMLAELVELVLGVDTHKHTHTAAVVTATTGRCSLRQRWRPPRPATASCWHWPTSSRASACGRSKALAATVLA